jgi:hypothetical protein
VNSPTNYPEITGIGTQMAKKPNKLPYKGMELIHEAMMQNQVAIYSLVDILKTPGLSDLEIFKRLGITIDQLHQANQILKTVPVVCKEEVTKQNGLGSDQTAGENKNIQFQEV